jgi:hypothetical protein
MNESHILARKPQYLTPREPDEKIENNHAISMAGSSRD